MSDGTFPPSESENASKATDLHLGCTLELPGKAFLQNTAPWAILDSLDPNFLRWAPGISIL